MATQLGIFEAEPALPEGMRYQRELISAAEETALLEQIRPLPFKEFEFHGFLGKRRVVSYGFKYEFSSAKVLAAEAFPEWLLALREKAGAFAGLAPESLVQASVLEYSAGAGIGWHRDRPVFGDVVGLSLLSPCGSGSGARWARSSSATRSPPSHAPHTSCAGRRGTSGTTASPESRRCGTR
ncbi:MAG: hypothetical protein QM723_10760 [Myxococcaceae bacterium]